MTEQCTAECVGRAEGLTPCMEPCTCFKFCVHEHRACPQVELLSEAGFNSAAFCQADLRAVQDMICQSVLTTFRQSSPEQRYTPRLIGGLRQTANNANFGFTLAAGRGIALPILLFLPTTQLSAW